MIQSTIARIAGSLPMLPTLPSAPFPTEVPSLEALAQQVGADPSLVRGQLSGLAHDREILYGTNEKAHALLANTAERLEIIARDFLHKAQQAIGLGAFGFGPVQQLLTMPMIALHAHEAWQLASAHLSHLDENLDQLAAKFSTVAPQLYPEPPVSEPAESSAPTSAVSTDTTSAVSTDTTSAVSTDTTSAVSEAHSAAQAGNSVAQAAVDAALSQVGTPYVWGGSAPGGFDCSGLVQWSYAQAGLDLPRTATEQAVGRQVSQEELQPGDLAVWSGHVAMYIGDGMMVEAGDPVQTNPVRTTNIGMPFQGFWRPTG